MRRLEKVGEEKVNLQELSQKVDELLNVLKVVSADLSDVSKSLKSLTVQKVGTPVSMVPSENKYNLNSVKEAFSSELADMLLFEESGKFVVVKPRRFLGSDNFAKIASIVRELGGEYVSAGRDSHFKIARQ
jgi:hypothetical protein